MSAPAFQPSEGHTRARLRLPGLRAVLLEQIRTTGLALRGGALLAAALVALLTLLGVLQSVGKGVAVDVHQWPLALAGFMGALLPIAVWARDERFGPGFFWTLPVDRRRHAFTKVFAGWVWLIGGVALFSLSLLALILASGGRVLPPETLHVLGSRAFVTPPIDPAALRTVRWAAGPLIWMVPFTAATATYLLASALLLGSRHPLRWVTGTIVSFGVLSAIGAAGVHLRVGWLGDAPRRLIQLLINSRYGLDALLTARTDSLSFVVTLTTGDRVVVWRAAPELADWGTATVLWTGAGLLALWAAASRHRETRRG